MTPKRHVSDFALFGGLATFTNPLHVGRPNIGDRGRLFNRLEDMLSRRWLTNYGPLAREFEHALTEVTGAPRVVATANATIALELLFRDVVAQRGNGEVVMPSFTFVGAAHAALNAGLAPRFVDVVPTSQATSAELFKEAVGTATRAILGVHLWGLSCDVEGLTQLAHQHSIPLFFDAAHGLGVMLAGQPLGPWGDATVFSFHATKIANAFEGGAIATTDFELAERLRLAVNFGFADVDQIVTVGTNAKMSEASAAMGLTSLEALRWFISVNRSHAAAYRRGLAELPGVTIVSPAVKAPSNHHYIVLAIEPETLELSRDTLIAALHAEGVLARRYFWPGCHRAEPYRSRAPWAGLSLPVSEALLDRTVSLPTGTALATEEVKQVCALISAIADSGGEIQQRFNRGKSTGLRS